MQEIHSLGGTRFFGVGGGGGGGGDRRLRQHHQNHQALKCPRCDSLNTKFCYYNNYNLSQPRHFCKSCRRYWTKGGVLRNVPVGGGCRKSKRSKPKNSPTSETSAAQTPPPSQPPEQERNSNSHSSSESSSLTAANTTAGATEALSAPSSNSASNNNNLFENIDEFKFFIHQNSNPTVEQTGLPEQGGDCGGIFSEIGNLTSLITSNTTKDTMGFEFGNIADASPFQFTAQEGGNDQLSQVQNTHQWQHHKVMSMCEHQDFKLPEITGGSLLDQTVSVELSELQSKANGGFESLDWHGGADQSLFDLPNTVDQAYWSQTQWTTDQDNLNSSLYLP